MLNIVLLPTTIFLSSHLTFSTELKSDNPPEGPTRQTVDR